MKQPGETWNLEKILHKKWKKNNSDSMAMSCNFRMINQLKKLLNGNQTGQGNTQDQTSQGTMESESIWRKEK